MSAMNAIGWIVVIVLYTALITHGIYDMRRFFSLRGKNPKRYRVIGHKRIIRWKFIPFIAPVVEYQGKTFVLEDASSQKIIPKGIEIRCFHTNGNIVFAPFVLLSNIIVLACVALILALLLSKLSYLAIYFCALIPILILASHAGDYWQIYGHKSLLRGLYFWKYRKRNIPKLSDQDYAVLIKENRILNYEEALAIEEKEQLLKLLLFIPVGVLLILSFMLQSLLI